VDRLKSKVAVITGGAKGIGRSAGILMAREGAKVALTDIDDDEGRKAVAEITEAGGEAGYWRLDVSEHDKVAEVFREIGECFGKIDVLVNNAGISGVDKPTHEIDPAEWMKVLNINLMGVFHCTKHVIPHMKKAGAGSIINISSIYGLVGAPDVPPYHASKGAVRLMSKTDALLYAEDAIRVNSVHPGYIWTPMVEEFAERSGKTIEEFRKDIGQLHPLGHPGEPVDIAYGIVYLASDESKFVTGSELVIDGGYTAR
jgi:NAD(P)-dependent dehydrogenase (short-subunit alcohol dehydrogenase family)